MSVKNIKDIANLAGVSYSTVSRVLNNKDNVNENTRKKVLDVLEANDYQPNILAQSLKNGQTRTICLIVPSITNGIFGSICEGVSDVARENGYTVILCNTNEDAQIEADFIEKMKQRWADGFIIASSRGDREVLGRLMDENIPLVLITRYRDEYIGKTDIISVDNYKAAYEGTKYLISKGLTKIAFAAGHKSLNFYNERLKGYKDALKDAGIPLNPKLVMQRKDTLDDFYDMTIKVMEEENPDAFFASSDAKAITIFRALHELKKSIPEDVSVLGFDDIKMASLLEPPLSTIAQPLYEFGKQSCESIIRQIEHKNKHGDLPKPIKHVMDYRLVIRQSTK